MRAVFFDLDGTLLNQDHQLSPPTIEVLNHLKKRQVKLCLASGRTYHSMRPFYQQLGLNTPLISYNGAKIVYGDGHIDESPLPQFVLTELVKLSRQHNLHLNVYSQDRWYTEFPESSQAQTYGAVAHLKPYPADFNVLQQQAITKALFIASPDQLMTLESSIKSSLSEWVDTTSSMNHFLEILSQGTNKGQAVKKVCHHLDVPLNQTMAFGDGLNDLEMLSTVGHSVAMSNGRDILKTTATALAPHHADHGVAHYLNHYFELNLDLADIPSKQ